MNRIIFILISFLFGISNASAQLSIGKSEVDGSGLLDFQLNTTKGIILPHILDIDSMVNLTEGTFVFDQKSTTIKYFDGSNWIDMNGIAGENPLKEEVEENDTTQGVIIGNDISEATGVLILESNDRALILPKIENPAKNVKSPYAGMICLDTISNNIYLFNGSYWTFWGIEDPV